MEITEGLLPCVLGILAVLFAGYGLPRVAQAIRRREEEGAALTLVRGGRALIVAAALATLAAGFSTGSEPLLWFGVAFLAEEIYETGVVMLILRYGRRKGVL